MCTLYVLYFIYTPLVFSTILLAGKHLLIHIYISTALQYSKLLLLLVQHVVTLSLLTLPKIVMIIAVVLNLIQQQRQLNYLTLKVTASLHIHCMHIPPCTCTPLWYCYELLSCMSALLLYKWSYHVSASHLIVASLISVITDDTPANKTDSNSVNTQTRPDAAQALRNKIQAVTDISTAVAQAAHVSTHMFILCQANCYACQSPFSIRGVHNAANAIR
jgi:hypothetical protein